MRNKQPGLQSGFSLVELMITVALAALISYGIASILRVGNIQAGVIGTQATLQESARDGLVRMVQEIRESAPSRITVNPNQVSFEIPESFDGTGNIVWSGAIVYALGGLNNAQLLRTDADGTVSVIANNVQNITFTANSASNPTLITIQLDLLRQTIQGRPYTATLRGEAQMRNGE